MMLLVTSKTPTKLCSTFNLSYTASEKGPNGNLMFGHL